jgi:hypothetical protein
MKKFAVLALLVTAGCAGKEQATPAADTTAVQSAPVADSAAAPATDSLMVRDTAAQN